MIQAPKNTLDYSEYTSITHVINNAFDIHQHRTMYSIGNTELSYKEVQQQSLKVAAYIQHQTSLKPGDKVAIHLANSLDYPIFVFGAFFAGLVIVNTNPRYTHRELKHQLIDSQVCAIFTQDISQVIDLADELGIHTLVGTNGQEPPPPRKGINTINLYGAKEIGAQYVNALVPVSNDLALLQYTGGTSGVPKGAMIEQSNLIAILLQNRQRLIDTFSPGDVYVVPTPLYHIYGFMLSFVMLVERGLHIVMLEDAGNLQEYVNIFKTWPVSGISGVNSLFVSLSAQADFRKLDFSNLKQTLSGGMTLNAETEQRWLSTTGCQILEGYGMTESAIVTSNPPHKIKLGTVGQASIDTLIKTVDDTGKSTPINLPGEVLVKGPQVFKGYWNHEHETSQIFFEDGWFSTGDIGFLDEEGYLTIVDRKKDMVVVSGFNVYPSEIESVVLLHSGVHECAAIGVDDAKTGEAVTLFVVANNDELLELDILAHCRANLTSYKVPRSIRIIDSLPKSPIGKILRKDLYQFV